MKMKFIITLYLLPLLAASSRIKRQEPIQPPSEGPKTLPQDAGLQDPPATDSPPETLFVIPDDDSSEIIPQTSTCVDLYPSCKTSWKGLCHTDSIKKNCPLSCDTCDEFGGGGEQQVANNTAPVCEDAPGTLCISNVVNPQVCQDIDTIRQSCPKSCGLCESVRDQPLISGGFVKEDSISSSVKDISDSVVDTLCTDGLPDGTCDEFKNECDKEQVYLICRKTCNKCEDIVTRLINKNVVDNASSDDADVAASVETPEQPVGTDGEEEEEEQVDETVETVTQETVSSEEVEDVVENEKVMENDVVEEETVEDESIEDDNSVEDENNSIVNSNNNQVVSTDTSSSSSTTTTFLLLLLTIAIAF